MSPAAPDRGPSPVTLFVAATLIWGSTWLAIKFQLGRVAPEVSVVYRFAVAGALLVAWCLARGVRLAYGRRDHAFLALQGALLFGFNYVGVYFAEAQVTSGLVAVAFSLITFMNPIAMRIVYRTPLSPVVLFAAALGVGGVALLFLPELRAARGGGAVAVGVGLAVGATLLASAGNVTALRNQRAGIPILPGTALAMLYGALAAAVQPLAQGASWAIDPSPAYLLSFAYLVLAGSIAAFLAYLTLISKVGPGTAGFVGVSTPVVALALSTAFEGYAWTGVAGGGVLLAIAGNVLALRAATSRA